MKNQYYLMTFSPLNDTSSKAFNFDIKHQERIHNKRNETIRARLRQ